MQRGLSPDASHESVMATLLAVHAPSLLLRAIHSRSAGSRRGRSRNRWCDVRTSTACPRSALHRGATSSVALSSLPHLSHWSPRASS
jgi:hypothetical protein